MEIDPGGIALRGLILVFTALYLWITIRALIIEVGRKDKPAWRRALWTFCLVAFQIAGPAAWYLNEYLEDHRHRA